MVVKYVLKEVAGNCLRFGGIRVESYDNLNYNDIDSWALCSWNIISVIFRKKCENGPFCNTFS